MERDKILEIFTKNKMMVEPKVLDYLLNKPEEVERILEKIKEMEQKPYFISMDFIKNLFEKEGIEIEEIKKESFEKKIVSIDDVSSLLLERYERIKSFFSYRMDIVNLISINKINEKMRKFSLIVMLREVDREKKTILAEDLSGERVFHVENDLINSLVEDEVVGLVCEKKNDEIKVTNILFPDIPIKRIIGKLDDEVFCLFSSFQIFEENLDRILEEIKRISFSWLSVFLFSDSLPNEEKIKRVKEKLPLNSNLILITEKEKGKIHDVLIFSNPTFLTLNKKINLLLCIGKIFLNYKEILGNDSGEIMLNLLKKRHLNPIFKLENFQLENNFLIDLFPDIFVSSNFGSSSLINYKGTTIISCGSSEKIFWIVNLKTRESLKISLM